MTESFKKQEGFWVTLQSYLTEGLACRTGVNVSNDFTNLIIAAISKFTARKKNNMLAEDIWTVVYDTNDLLMLCVCRGHLHVSAAHPSYTICLH